MWSMKYKGHYVQGYCDREECRALIRDTWRNFRSLQAAKVAITKLEVL